jgi:DNA primase
MWQLTFEVRRGWVMWLDDALKAMTLTEEVEGYLLGRGAMESTIAREGIVTWKATEFEIPDPAFTDVVYGRHGEKLNGYLVCPVRSPRGSLIGFEARNIHKKNIQDFRFIETKYTPFFLGTREAMPAIWAGGDVWICEGLFDKMALEWAVPASDAVLATVSAKLTDLHLEFLRRFCTGWVNMVYDHDETGRRATVGWVDTESGKKRYGALDALRRVGLKCRDMPYSGGKDPGEIWDHGGAAAIRAAFAK